MADQLVRIVIHATPPVHRHQEYLDDEETLRVDIENIKDRITHFGWDIKYFSSNPLPKYYKKRDQNDELRRNGIK